MKLAPSAPIVALGRGVAAQLVAAPQVPDAAAAVAELVANALDATGGAGRITVQLLELGPADIAFTVEDDGAGIAAESFPLLAVSACSSKLLPAAAARAAAGGASAGVGEADCVGFKGQALAALAQMGTLEIVSRARGVLETFAKLCHAGREVRCGPSDAPRPQQGTTVRVSSFGVTQPVRRRAMLEEAAGGASAERILSRLTALMLPWPEVELVVTGPLPGGLPARARGAVTLLRLAKGRPLPEMFSRLLTEVNPAALRPIAAASPAAAVAGCAAPPEAACSGGDQRHVYVGRRAVTCEALTALLEAWFARAVLWSAPGDGSTLLARSARQSRPAYVLQLACPPGAADLFRDCQGVAVCTFRDWPGVAAAVIDALAPLWGAPHGAVRAALRRAAAGTGLASGQGRPSKQGSSSGGGWTGPARSSGLGSFVGGGAPGFVTTGAAGSSQQAAAASGVQAADAAGAQSVSPPWQTTHGGVSSRSRSLAQVLLPPAPPGAAASCGVLAAVTASGRPPAAEDWGRSPPGPSHPPPAPGLLGLFHLTAADAEVTMAGGLFQGLGGGGSAASPPAARAPVSPSRIGQLSDADRFADPAFELLPASPLPAWLVQAPNEPSTPPRAPGLPPFSERAVASAPPHPRRVRRAAHATPASSLFYAAPAAASGAAAARSTVAGVASELRRQQRQQQRWQGSGGADQQRSVRRPAVTSRRVSQQQRAVELLQQEAPAQQAPGVGAVPVWAVRPAPRAGFDGAAARLLARRDAPLLELEQLELDPAARPGGAARLVPATVSRADLRRATVLEQVDRKALAVRCGDLLVAVDQHAADERVQLERLHALLLQEEQPAALPGGGRSASSAWCERGPLLQSLAFSPCKALALNPGELQALQSYREQTERWGWRVQVAPASLGASEGIAGGRPGAGDRVVLAAAPLICGVVLGPFDLALFLHQLRECGAASAPPPGVLRVLRSKACRSALMFGDAITQQQGGELLRLLANTQLPFCCAHGRPTTAPLVDMGALRQLLARLTPATARQARLTGGAREESAAGGGSAPPRRLSVGRLERLVVSG